MGQRLASSNRTTEGLRRETSHDVSGEAGDVRPVQSRVGQPPNWRGQLTDEPASGAGEDPDGSERASPPPGTSPCPTCIGTGQRFGGAACGRCQATGWIPPFHGGPPRRDAFRAAQGAAVQSPAWAQGATVVPSFGRPPTLCVRCLETGIPVRVTPGQFSLEVLLWLFFLLPGLLYSLWRVTQRHEACHRCGGKELVPPDSQRARRLASSE